MSDDAPKPLLALTWRELRRRKVVRVAIAYGLVAWVILQLGEITFEPLGLPPRALTWTILAVVLLFPVALVLAWVFDHDGDRLRVDHTGHNVRGPARLFALAVVLLTVGGLAWWLVDVYGDRPMEGADPPIAGLGATAVDAAGAPSGAAPANSIAVLPFDDMSADGDQGWFADGLAEELLDRLARIEGLQVAARTSAFALRGRALDAQALGRALNVATLVEGSVRKAGGRLRVTAQLIDTANGYHLWTETYEGADQDIFELQDEVTADIVAQLRDRIPGLRPQSTPDPVTQATTSAATTRDVLAHELYLQGRLAWRQRTAESLGRAAGLFEQAIERDAGYARAWCGLADTRLLLSDYGGVAPEQAVAQAEPAVVRALDLAPGLGEAWASLGLLRLNAGQLEAAEGNLREAIRLDPNYEMAYMWLGGLYARQGRLRAQSEVLAQALALSPLDPAININLAGSRFARGERAAARDLLAALLRITPEAQVVRYNLSEFERGSGNLAEALRLADQAWRRAPSEPQALMTLANALSALRRHDEAQGVLARLPAGMANADLLRHNAALHRDPATPLPAALADQVEALLAGNEPVHPDQRPLLQFGAWAAWWAGDPERALRIVERVLAGREGARLLQDEMDSVLVRAFLLKETGRDEAAATWLALARARVDELREQGWANAYADFSLGLLELFEGRPDQALEHLDAAIGNGFGELWLLDGDPRWHSLRGTSGFAAVRANLLRRIDAERALAADLGPY
ncbi:MAG: tetratricopeptide repeat protein [Xanthomonadales bacterium]|nr:tetratricopeptide repeat protein [Xanthomonadales bacterium]